ncbi:MAG: helix-turn-helix domain-containing protein [bacterium]
MKDRLLKFLNTENISYTHFADEIGVQRSSISHILSGRNKPSFDFIQKILGRYNKINPEWLIMGTGSMYKNMSQPSLFDNISSQERKKEPSKQDDNILPDVKFEKEASKVPDNTNSNTKDSLENLGNDEIERIVIFFKNGRFRQYIP